MEIGNLKKDTNKMDSSLKEYNKVNANLGFIVDDLRTRQEEMTERIKQNRAQIRINSTQINGFKKAVYNVVQYIDDSDQLKMAV